MLPGLAGMCSRPDSPKAAWVYTLHKPRVTDSARAGAERRARGEWTRPHPEVWTERGRNTAQEVSAAGTAALTRNGTGGIGAQPVATGSALRVDTLHGQARQIVHEFPLSSSLALQRR